MAKPKTTLTTPTNKELIGLLGNVAILEGGLGLGDGNVQEDLISAISPCLILDNIYRDHEKLSELPLKKINTLVMETTFTYQDKIQDAYIALAKVMQESKWKPKRIINTMEYGLDKLFVMCEPLGIDVYRVKDNYDRDAKDDEEFELIKIEYVGLDYDFLKIEYGYLLTDN